MVYGYADVRLMGRFNAEYAGRALSELAATSAIDDANAVRIFCDDSAAMERKLKGAHPMEAVGYCRAVADIRALLRMT